jgi:hypothetical protein
MVAGVLPNEQYALWTVIVSYVLWGIGLPLGMMVMVIYLLRLALHKLPPKAVIVSVFLPLGPLGQGSLGYVKSCGMVGSAWLIFAKSVEAGRLRQGHLSKNPYIRRVLRDNVLYARLPRRAHSVVFWFSLAVFRFSFDRLQQDLSF